MGKGKRTRRRRLGVRLLQRVPPTACPRCQSVMLTASGIAERPEDTIPHPGALTLCDQCATWLVFTDKMGLRLATKAEIATIDPTLRKVAVRMLAAIDHATGRTKH